MLDLAGTSVPPHGTRSFYVKGCRCNECRAANVDYYKARRKNLLDQTKNDSVDAAGARGYLSYLSENGVGRNSIHKACGVGKRLIWEITSGRASRILRSTEARILSINPQVALPHKATVDAELALLQIDALVSEGFTKSEIAERLYRCSDRLRIGKGDRIRVSNAIRVNALYQALMPREERDEFMDAA